MTALEKTLAEITHITINIETNYPELYRNLNEDPITIPSLGTANMNLEVMQEYLDNLKQLLKQYLETKKVTGKK